MNKIIMHLYSSNNLTDYTYYLIGQSFLLPASAYFRELKERLAWGFLLVAIQQHVIVSLHCPSL